MLAVEGFDGAPDQAFLAGVFNQHLAPGDQLQDPKVAATEVEAPGQNQEDFQ